jgi:hypothetical protein
MGAGAWCAGFAAVWIAGSAIAQQRPADAHAVLGTSSTIAAPLPLASSPTSRKDLGVGIQELTFADGSVYRGTLRAGVPHGHGTYESPLFRYEGDFDAGRKQGLGEYRWVHGDRYEGGFRDDQPDGRGRYVFANGDLYEGEVHKGEIRGRGRYRSAEGDEFEGDFARGLPEGRGVLLFSNGDRYVGEMRAGRMQGFGRYTTREGDRIEARFAGGRAQGIGQVQEIACRNGARRAN